jgi:imidazoleglycerol-phosphate dehydratase
MGISVERSTKETTISVEIDFAGAPSISVETGVRFFDHMLEAMAFHGAMECTIRASGDIDVDPHHLVEDVGIVLGEAVSRFVEERGPVVRFGQAVIPMDDALAEVVIDLSGRPYLVYRPVFPQPTIGAFDVSLIREFLQGFSSRGRLNLHAECRYGENSHHMVEALFKALGRALRIACAPGETIRSTKGVL